MPPQIIATSTVALCADLQIVVVAPANAASVYSVYFIIIKITRV